MSATQTTKLSAQQEHTAAVLREAERQKKASQDTISRLRQQVTTAVAAKDAMKHKRDADYRMQHLRDPPPVGIEELEATVLGRVVSSGVADGANLELSRPTEGAASSDTVARPSRNWRRGQNANDGLRSGELPGSGQN